MKNTNHTSNYTSKNYTSKLLDPTGVAISLGCLAHCLLLPFLIPLLPGVESLGGEQVHKTLVVCLLVIAGISLFKGFSTHRNLSIPTIGLVGLTFLVLAITLPEDFSSQKALLHLSVEATLTVVGGAMLIVAHIRNYSLCRCRNLIKSGDC